LFIPEGTRAVALDVLRVLVQYSPSPLSNALIETAFPAACQCVLNSEDHSTLQSGGEVIRSYLSNAAQQVIAHRDNEGQTGLQYILQIIGQLLNPQVTIKKISLTHYSFILKYPFVIQLHRQTERKRGDRYIYIYMCVSDVTVE